MSDSYELLIDKQASADNASEIGDALIGALIAEGVILPDPNSECVLTGAGFRPGPRVRELYTCGDDELDYWNMLDTIGVKLHTERYVNFFGFPVFEISRCPACNGEFSDDHSIMDAIYNCVGAFINDKRLDSIVCPCCSAQIRCDRWTTVPDIGFCHVALEFWNWPSFTATVWSLSIPDLLSRRTGRKLTHSWGRM